MKNKLITLIVFLVALVTCFACSSEKEVIENTDNKQNLQILKTDFKLTQEQTLSKIKAEYLLENNGYKDDDEIRLNTVGYLLQQAVELALKHHLELFISFQ